MSDRKHVRVVIPSDKVEAFKIAKAKAEDLAMITLTDSQFASRLVQKAIVEIARK
jgi:hypothetical protein